MKPTALFSATDTLHAIQHEFARALRTANAPLGYLAIYHNNRVANFRKALALAFPVVEALVGAPYFAQLARRYQTEHPSRHGDLQHVSTAFPQFLREHFAAPETDRYRYIAEVAYLEEAFQHSLIAADATALAPSALAGTSPSSWPTLRLQIHPAARILALRWPVFELWRAHRHDRVEPMTLAADEQWLQIARLVDTAGDAVSEVRPLDAATGRFLAALAAGATLGAATDAALCTSADFELGVALHRGFAEGLFCAITQERPEDGAS
jgi:hypothetical protein